MDNQIPIIWKVPGKMPQDLVQSSHIQGKTQGSDVICPRLESLSERALKWGSPFPDSQSKTCLVISSLRIICSEEGTMVIKLDTRRSSLNIC